MCLPGNPRLSNMREQCGTRAAFLPEAVCVWGGQEGVVLAAVSPNSPRETFLHDSLKLPGLELHNPHSGISARKPFRKRKSISLLQLLSQTNRKGPEPYLLHRMQSSERSAHMIGRRERSCRRRATQGQA